MSLIRFFLCLTLLSVCVLFLFVGWLSIRPLAVDFIVSNPDPATSYQSSLTRIAKLKTNDVPPIARAAYTKVLLHGKKTERAVLLLHGLTNNPRQCALLGEKLFNQGYNVFIPRFPHHGNADVLVEDLSSLRVDELVSFSDDMVDIMQGLGEHVTVVGLSLGGTVATWLAHTREDVDYAIAIGPLLNYRNIPTQLLKPLSSLVLVLPDAFIWWDSEKGAELVLPEGVYPRFSTHAVGNILQLGWKVYQQSASHAPASRKILFVTNAYDKAINNETVDKLYQNWKMYRECDVDLYEFSDHPSLDHDLLDPDQFPQNVTVVYPVLIDLINKTHD